MRSCASDRGPYDAVLVKDVGVSCTITDKDSKNSILENYLLDRLKTEYSDLSTITKKIGVYTKDILQSLSSRSKGMARSIRKNIRQPEAGRSSEKSKFLQKLTSESTSTPVALQCSDQNGNPCLKLRLEGPPLPVPKRRSVSRNDTSVNRFLNPLATKPPNPPKNSPGDSRRNMGKNRVLVLRQDESTCRPVDSVKRIFPKEREKAEVHSSGCSSSSIYNFLMSGKRKSWQKGRSIEPGGGCYEGNSECLDPGMMEDDEALREQYRILVPSRTKGKLSATGKSSKDSWSETFHAVNIRIIKRAPKDS
ncbi:uncharacterized protein LOC107264533 isoform X3 [Cephus cinctus]|uniref:Uncharacterized protein LOC107264533 isoform X3 n=1 Tax=Cephus cinctus TaxID=211228 RepID=A0AAJ7RB33_CEPCN|nr:uncharacterized protein LOC107264533 isoform X3 [Cephus cinctus]